MIAYHIRYTSQNRLFLNALRTDATLCRLKQLIILLTRRVSQLNTCSPTFLWMAGRCQDDELLRWGKKMDPEKLSSATDHSLSDLAFPDVLSSEMLNILFKAILSKFLSIYGCSHPLLRSGRIISNIFCILFNFWFRYMPFLQFGSGMCTIRLLRKIFQWRLKFKSQNSLPSCRTWLCKWWTQCSQILLWAALTGPQLSSGLVWIFCYTTEHVE